eukprot:scaffold1029_cov387-Prasinococcus_capsulatus_cf.AAC.2
MAGSPPARRRWPTSAATPSSPSCGLLLRSSVFSRGRAPTAAGTRARPQFSRRSSPMPRRTARPSTSAAAPSSPSAGLLATSSSSSWGTSASTSTTMRAARGPRSLSRRESSRRKTHCASAGASAAAPSSNSLLLPSSASASSRSTSPMAAGTRVRPQLARERSWTMLLWAARASTSAPTPSSPSRGLSLTNRCCSLGSHVMRPGTRARPQSMRWSHSMAPEPTTRASTSAFAPSSPIAGLPFTASFRRRGSACSPAASARAPSGPMLLSLIRNSTRCWHPPSEGASTRAPASLSALEGRLRLVRVGHTQGGSTRAISAAPTRRRSPSDNSAETAGPSGHKSNLLRRRQSASASPSRRAAASSRSSPSMTMIVSSAARRARGSAHSTSRPSTSAMG